MRRLAFATALSTSLVLLSAPAFAQDAADETDAMAPGEIVVTAQKRSESLQSVPVAVSVLSSPSVSGSSRSRASKSAMSHLPVTLLRAWGASAANAGGQTQKDPVSCRRWARTSAEALELHRIESATSGRNDPFSSRCDRPVAGIMFWGPVLRLAEPNVKVNPSLV